MKGKGYKITPPPKDKGPEPLFRVVYTIDDTGERVKVWRVEHRMDVHREP